MFDIKQFQLLDTAVLTVQTADESEDLLVDGKPVKITICSSGTEQAVSAQYKLDNASTARMASAWRGKAIKNQAQISEQEQIEKLVKITVSIENFPIEGGAQALYSDPKLGYIKRQVQKFHADDGNFMPPSTTS
jgi:hypothetical protein